jgi:hypothetical protein
LPVARHVIPLAGMRGGRGGSRLHGPGRPRLATIRSSASVRPAAAHDKSKERRLLLLLSSSRAVVACYYCVISREPGCASHNMARVARVFVTPLHVTSRHAPTLNACWANGGTVCWLVYAALRLTQSAHLHGAHTRPHGTATQPAYRTQATSSCTVYTSGAYLVHARFRGPGCILQWRRSGTAPPL